jgi:hypothetical protein
MHGQNLTETSRKVLIKYDPKGVDPSFWQKLYGYSKGKYRYPGLLGNVCGVERLAKTLLAVPESEVEKVRSFLREQGAEFEERGTVDQGMKLDGEVLRWNQPPEILEEELEGLGEDMDRLGPFIRAGTKRDALEDVERYGY